jgi:tetratricopeptide (TPR) repeat protein
MSFMALWCRAVRTVNSAATFHRREILHPLVLRRLLAQLLQQAWRGIGKRGDRAGAPRPPTASMREAFEALLRSENYEAAYALAEEALARDAESYEARLLLGRALQKLHEPARALECFELASRVRPDDAELYDFRGSMYQELGRLREAMADYERALSLRPDFPLASFHRAMAQLLAGDFERGWDGYELRRLGAPPEAWRSGLPRWDGTSLAGRSLFVAREQGLGDEIMFASILPQLIGQARHCVVECDPRLLATFTRSFPAATVVGTPPGGGQPRGVDPARIDAVIESGSLPRLLRRKAADFPRHEGYLRADPQQVGRWRERLEALGPGLKVGISWAGGVRMTRRALRSMALDQLLPVLRSPGARFVSLQYTAEARTDIAALEARHGMRIEHWSEAIDDYDQTAALVCALDLVVSVCTALVHLGGALGRPVWVMAPYSPEWRYGFSGESMPWYPSVRLFRQPAYGEWGPVIADVARELAARAG